MIWSSGGFVDRKECFGDIVIVVIDEVVFFYMESKIGLDFYVIY